MTKNSLDSQKSIATGGIVSSVIPGPEHAAAAALRARTEITETGQDKSIGPVAQPVDYSKDKEENVDTGMSALALLALAEKSIHSNFGGMDDYLPDSLGKYISEDFEVHDGVEAIIDGQRVTADNFYSGYSSSGGGSSFEGVFRQGNYDISGFIPKIGKASSIHADGSFEQAFGIVVASEGGFSNHRADRGGATIFGIASKANPSEYSQVMSLLANGDKQGAMNVTLQTYKTKYWDKAGIGNIQDPEARLVAFDAAINHGAGYARKMIRNVGEDANAMLRYRANTYIEIVNNDPSQGVFMNGWRNRLAKLDSIVANDAAPSVQMASSQYSPAAGSKLARTFQSADAIKLPNNMPVPAIKHQEPGLIASATSYVSKIASGVTDYIPKFWS